MVQECARVLARFHALQPPVSKHGREAALKVFDSFDNQDWAKGVNGKAYLEVLDKFPKLKEKYGKSIRRSESSF